MWIKSFPFLWSRPWLSLYGEGDLWNVRLFDVNSPVYAGEWRAMVACKKRHILFVKCCSLLQAPFLKLCSRLASSWSRTLANLSSLMCLTRPIASQIHSVLLSAELLYRHVESKQLFSDSLHKLSQNGNEIVECGFKWCKLPQLLRLDQKYSLSGIFADGLEDIAISLEPARLTAGK